MKNYFFRKIMIGFCVLVLFLPLVSLVKATPAPQGGINGAPTMVSYQGNVLVGETPFTGTAYFKFVVTNTNGTESYWSNDGSSKGGEEPENGVPLEVDSGLFNVLLGDTILTGMTQALTADIFDGTDRWLRVWFSTDDITFQLLDPDTRIASVPYALQAQEAVNANTLDNVDGAAYQRRVNGACEVGSTIKTINPNGNVVCEGHDTKPGFYITMVDPTAATGHDSSISIGEDGLPVVSYTDLAGDLKIVHCGAVSCTSGNTISTVDDCECAKYTSITIGSDGLPVISYYDNANGNLKVAHCEDVACAEKTLTTVDSTDDVGSYSSIAIGVDGFPIISYYDTTGGNLKIAHCEDVYCTIATIQSFTTTQDRGKFTSIAIGIDGMPVISFYDQTNGELRVGTCSDISCTGFVSYRADGEIDHVGPFTSLTIGGDGLPVISYYDLTNQTLKVLHCGNADCSLGNTITTVDDTDDVGKYSSITIGMDNLPVISYFDHNNDNLKVVHCGDSACTSGNIINTLDTTDVAGRETAITIGVDGMPLISYRDQTNHQLKVAHCSNVFCTPYWRRR